MAIADSYGLFWNSDNGDRRYNADSMEKWLKKFFTSGVFEGDLQVLESVGMSVAIQPGYCNLFGKVGLFETTNNIALTAAHSTYPRIDTIVIERNDSDRIISLKSIEGTYSGSTPRPTAPVWDESSGIYQLVLAQIYVGAGVSAVTQANITDTRPINSLCGYITGTVEEVDFSQFAAQFLTYYNEFKNGNEADFQDWMIAEEADFVSWYNRIKDQLSEDAAGALQVEIDDMDARIGKRLATQTLAIGETTLTFTDSSIETTSTIEVYADRYGVSPRSVVTNNGEVVVTFKAQTAATSVYIVVKE